MVDSVAVESAAAPGGPRAGMNRLAGDHRFRCARIRRTAAGSSISAMTCIGPLLALGTFERSLSRKPNGRCGSKPGLPTMSKCAIGGRGGDRNWNSSPDDGIFGGVSILGLKISVFAIYRILRCAARMRLISNKALREFGMRHKAASDPLRVWRKHSLNAIILVVLRT